MMKNTERLPENVLKILRYMYTGGADDKSEDDDINTMTPNEMFKEFLAYHGIGSWDGIVKNAFMAIYGISEELAFRLFITNVDGRRKWCCWVLDEDEISHAVEEIVREDKVDNFILKEQQIQDVAERFKERLGVMGEEWEYELKCCIVEVMKEHDDELRGMDEKI